MISKTAFCISIPAARWGNFPQAPAEKPCGFFRLLSPRFAPSAPHGSRFCPATFRNSKRRKENFEQMQLFPLDFDGKNPISLKEVYKRAEQLDLPTLFSYETFSSTDRNRFRVVFLNDVPIEDVRAAEIKHNALRTIFPESDNSCTVANMYYGGKKLLKYDDSVPIINIESLIRNMTLFLKCKHGATHYKKHIERFAGSNNIALTKTGFLDISTVEGDAPNADTSHIDSTEQSDLISSTSNSISSTNNHGCKNWTKPITIIKSNDHKLPNQYYLINLDDTTNCSDVNRNNENVTSHNSVAKNSAENAMRNRTPYRTAFLGDIGKMCKLYSEFETGSRRLTHQERFGIGTNLIHVESGINRFISIMYEHTYYDGGSSKYDKWRNDIGYAKANNYKPWSCNFFCPHKDICLHGANILSTVKPERGTMEKIPGHEEKYHSLDEVSAHLEELAMRAITANDTNIHIIKAPTATGKSEIFLRILKLLRLKFLYANPTNILKDDIFERAKKKEIEVFKTPSLHDKEIADDLPKAIKNYIDYLYNSGQHYLVNRYISKIADEEGIDSLKVYLANLEKFKKCEGSVITTHRRMVNMDGDTLKNFDAIIIDEDFVLTSVIPNQGKVSIKDLRKMRKIATKQMQAGLVTPGTCDRLLAKIRRVKMCIETKMLFKLDGFVWDVDEDGAAGGAAEIEIEDISGADMPTPIDISAFCLAEHFCFRKKSKEEKVTEDTVAFLKPCKLRDDMKYIMISATADENICRRFFGEDRVTFYNCKKARYKGILNQYHDKSMSRSCITENPGIISRIREWTGSEHFITHKKFAGDDGLYFGNCAGIDYLKGRNLDIIGTPYHAEFIYKLFAFSIGIKSCDENKPKLFWDHLYYNYNRHLITSEQYSRTLERDKYGNYPNRRFVNDFIKYDKLVAKLLPSNDIMNEIYFYDSMNYYHLEIYKRIDFMYKFAARLDSMGMMDIDKDNFLVKRFHPIVFWPISQDGSFSYREKHKYYKPLLMTEEDFQKSVCNVRDPDEHKIYAYILTILHTIRAKTYEVFNHNFIFSSSNYNQMSEFIFNHFNMTRYHEADKEWGTGWEDADRNSRQTMKKLITNIEKINKALFGDSGRRNDLKWGNRKKNK